MTKLLQMRESTKTKFWKKAVAQEQILELDPRNECAWKERKRNRSLWYNTCLRKCPTEVQQSFAKLAKKFCHSWNSEPKLSKTIWKLPRLSKRNSTYIKNWKYPDFLEIIPWISAKDRSHFGSEKEWEHH